MIHPRAGAAALLGCLAVGAAQADVLILSNGDRYTGVLESMIDGELKFRTEYGQQLSLPWALVQSVDTDEPVKLSLEGDTWVAGRLAAGSAGMADLQDSQSLDPVSFALASVVAINPPTGPGAAPVTTQGRINFGANRTEGNTRTDSLRASAELVARSAQNRYTLGGEANYGKDGGTRNKNDAIAYVRYDHFVDERWYLNSNVSAAHDEFRNLDLRTTFGVGLGNQVLATPRHRLSFETGINYVHESLLDGGSESRPAGRLASDYELRLGSDNFSLFHRNETLIGLDDLSDLLVRARTGLRFPLANRLSGTVQHNIDYDRTPAGGNRRTDTGYLLTLGYAW